MSFVRVYSLNKYLFSILKKLEISSCQSYESFDILKEKNLSGFFVFIYFEQYGRLKKIIHLQTNTLTILIHVEFEHLTKKSKNIG